MIKKFNEHSESKNILLFYSFDWDDNILNMPTVIHMEKLIDGEWVPTDVSTSEFAEVRNDKENWRILDNDPDKAFSEFRDSGPRGDKAFLEDMKKAIAQSNFGPSWDDFIECLVNGSIFSIITARGHEEGPMRMGIEWIIDNILTENEKHEMYSNLLKFAYLYKDDIDKESRILKNNPSDSPVFKNYLDYCDFIGVSSPSREGSADNPEQAKVTALLQFKNKINNLAGQIGYKAKIGFSDDDLGNVKHIEDLVDNLKHEEFPNIIHYVVKGTKNPDDITKKVKTLETAQTSGLESSVMPFTQFNNMTNRLHPKGEHGRKDDYLNKMRRETEFLAKTSKEILAEEEENRKKKKKHPKKKKKD